MQQRLDDQLDAPGSAAGTADQSRRLWNRRTADLIPYTPGEQPRGVKLIKLNTNENPYPPPPGVVAALQSYTYDRLRLYPDPTSLQLRQAIAAYYGLDAAQVFVGNGSDEVLALAFQAFFNSIPQAGAVDPARAIVFPDVTYSFYPVYARFYSIPWRTVPLDDDFSLPVQALLEPSAGLVLSNPNAPTGMAVPCSLLA